MPQFFVNEQIEQGSTIEIRGSDAHHISKVLRLTSGDWLVLSDGLGRSFRATIVNAQARCITAKIESEIERRTGPRPPALAIASIRSERLEWAAQKCVELGLCHIIPFNSARTVRKRANLTRLKRITAEAAKQSGLPVMPSVHAPLEFDELCARLPNFDPSILLYEGESRNDLRSVLKKYKSGGNSAKSEGLIIIGPEGGFTAEEVEMALSRGAIPTSLGTQILRAETAAVVALAICQYELGNMDAS